MGHTKVRCKKPLVEEDGNQSGEYTNAQEPEADPISGGGDDNWGPSDVTNGSTGGW